jgi:hypothetical protein
VLGTVRSSRVPGAGREVPVAGGLVESLADPLVLLHERTARIVAELRQARSRLESARSPRTLDPAIRAFGRAERLLDRPLRVAIIGEFNSGKSSLANLLARTESLPTAVVSNTRIPTLLYYAREPEIWAVDERGNREWLRADYRSLPPSIFRLEVGLPTRRLRTVQILDLPGCADPRFQGRVSDAAVHDVHAVMWCTLSTQAWKESERIAWGQLPERLRDRSLLVSTHADLLHDPRDAEKLLHRLRGQAGGLFQEIVLVSTLDALALIQARWEGWAGDSWTVTGADALEAALHRLLLKLRDQRADSALRMTGRIAHRALSRLGKVPA